MSPSVGLLSGRRVRPTPGLVAFTFGTSFHRPWVELYYRNLVRHFVDEILDDNPEACTFYDDAKSPEIVDAISRSHHERAWVELPGA